MYIRTAFDVLLDILTFFISFGTELQKSHELSFLMVNLHLDSLLKFSTPLVIAAFRTSIELSGFLKNDKLPGSTYLVNEHIDLPPHPLYLNTQ